MWYTYNFHHLLRFMNVIPIKNDKFSESQCRAITCEIENPNRKISLDAMIVLVQVRNSDLAKREESGSLRMPKVKSTD